MEKMPEGWKKFSRPLLESNYSNLGNAEDLYKAMDLMKEMAETLEYYAEGGHTEPFSNRLANNFAEEYPGKVANDILKKFKEWK